MRTIIVEVPDKKCDDCIGWFHTDGIIGISAMYKCPYRKRSIQLTFGLKPTKPCRAAEVKP